MNRPARTRTRTLGVSLAALVALGAGVVPALALTLDNHSAPTNLGGTKSGVFTDAQTRTYNGAGTTIAVIDGAFYPNAPQFKNADGSSAVVLERCIGQIGGTWPSLCANPSAPADRSVYPDDRTGMFLGSGSSKASNAPDNTCTNPDNPDNLCHAWHGNMSAGVAAGRPFTYTSASLGGTVTYAGVAPGASLALFKVGGGTGGTGTTPFTQWWPPASILDALFMIEAIVRAPAYAGALRDNPITAVTISSSGVATTTQAACAPGSDGARMDAQAARLKQYGIAVFFSAGNDSKNTANGSYTCGSNIVVVGATEVTTPTEPTAYSNLSTNVDLLAPVGSGTACPNCIATTYLDGGGTRLPTGTSFAAPQAAGAFAVLRQKHPFASVDKLLALLKSTGKPLTGSRASFAPTARVIDLDAALDGTLTSQ